MGDILLDERTIFRAARQIESPEARWDYLKQACGDDDALINRMLALLRVHDEEPGFLESMPWSDLGGQSAVAAATVDQPISEGPGTVIGRYKLLELIGEGGFGNVYLAEQTEPVHRKVALKIIKLGMDTKSVIARFEAERQALALMDHPNIAKVLDAGATETGRPYFVMDLVRGWPITEYCDANNLTTRERLRLFIDVCDAVQHAHQKGIIHRDIKATNVMVTLRDTKPVSKIIDFGIAKATQQRLTEKTLFTEHRQLVGTPEYMSPEQATFGESDVDTRSDIYSLGVLLYELLVGTTPFDAEALRTRGYDEICQVIRESDPPTPSKRLSTLGDAGTNISKHRHAEPPALRKLLQGDLDWIVMKALEKDRTRRYETVYGLARDIERHLDDEPVRARPPSAGYRLKKFVRKHRVAVAATIAVLGALVVGLALTALGFFRAEHERRIATEARDRAENDRRIATSERDRANAERDRAEENLELARQLVSEVILPATDRMSDFPFAVAYKGEVLEKARVFYEQILAQAASNPEPRREMAKIHRRLGRLAWDTGQDAEPAFRRNLSVLEDLAREYPTSPDYRWDLSESHRWLSIWNTGDMRHDEAAEARRISLRILEDLAAQFPSNEAYREALAEGNHRMGWYLARLSRFNEAEPYNRAAVSMAGPFAVHIRVRSRQDYAYLLLQLARYDEAKWLLDEALRITTEELALEATPPNTGWRYNLIWHTSSHRMVGLLSFYTARFEDAERHLRQAIDPIAKWSDDFQPVVWPSWLLGWWHHDLAEVLTAMGRLEEAEEARRQSLAAWELTGDSVLAAFPHGKSLAHYRWGELLHKTGRTEQAAGQFAEALAIMEDLSRRRPDSPACQWQVICLLSNGPDPAFRDPQRAVALAKNVLPEQAGHYWRYLALAEYRSGDWQAAADSIQRAMDLRQGGDAFDWLLLAMAHWQLGQKEEALASYTRAQEAFKAGKPIFYEYLGVMAVDRLRSEAETLLGERTGDVEEE